jgi:glycosidase
VPAYVDSKLPSLTDFGLRDQFVKYLQGQAGLYNIFNVIAKDHLFSDPYNLVTFVDNHDVGRGMFYADTNMAKMKMVYHMLMTLRGIPQVFYGSEIGMIENEDHGTLRKKFPGGGWADDTRDAFTSEGRTAYENEIFDYLKMLLHLRKDHEVIRRGKLTHFPIHDNVYVYFKTLDDEMVINIINDNDKPTKVDLDRYSVMMKDASKMKNLKTLF